MIRTAKTQQSSATYFLRIARNPRQRPPTPVLPYFSGGAHGADGILTALGFEMINTRDRDPSDSSLQ